MKKLLICLVVAASNGCGDVAWACETEATAKPDSECVVMPRGQARGVWFTLDVANTLRKEHELLPELQLQLKSYAELNQIRDQQVAGLKEADALRKDVSQKLLDTTAALARDAERARQERDKAKDELDAWYRSPFLWTGVGVLATVATVVAVGYASHAF